MNSSQSKTLVVPPQSYKSIGTKSEKFLQDFYRQGLTTPCRIPILEIVNDWPEFEEQTGFQLVAEELPPGVLGRTDFVNNLITIPPETCVAAKNGDGRARFTIAHEVGHVWLHNVFFKGCILENRILTANRACMKTYEDPDWQAEAFASALLMPSTTMATAISNGLSIADMQMLFQVSYKAAIKRTEIMKKFT
ncbi:MAG: hypothetical protein GQF41_4304 [Candidatus Rifleibacterium amylolyticum]|nr:MAG: hypothetical protein GQF41_4304 [Candidatus Rifleibacterium amylolyticum]